MKTKLTNNTEKRSFKPVVLLNTILTAGLLAMTGTAKATLNAYEPFNYTIGASTTPTTATGTPTQTTGGGFASSYQGGGNTAVAGLTYPGLGVNANALNQTASYSGVNLSSPISSGTVYVSFLFNMAVNPGGNRVGLEMNTGGYGMFVGFTAPFSGTQGYWGVNQQGLPPSDPYDDNAANLFQYPSANITYGTTYFCVVKLEDAGANWNGSIWINPTAGTSTETPSTPDGTFTVPKFTISACSFVNPNGGNFNFDELRLADSWADAVVYTAPAPVSVAITSPADGSTVGSYFQIQATASVSPGSVTNVNFYDSSTLLGGDTSAPFSYSYSGAPAGAHTFSAVAYASDGTKATNTINVTVTNTPPLVVYEPFDYPLGAINNGTMATGSGLSGNWTFANNGSDSIVAGLTYPNLPSANNALKQTQASVRSFVSFASPVAGGTKYFSFLFKNVGNSGGDTVGTYLIGSGSTSLYVGFNGGYSADQTSFGLGTVSTAGGTTASASTMWSTTPVSNTGTNLIVVRIDFDTSGANDLVSLWVNPPAGTNSPGVAANLTSSTHDVGTISGFGLNVLGGYAPIVDELNVGDDYASVVGGTPAVPTIATTIDITTNPIVQVSWTAQSTNNYQPQSSPDNSTWSNLGGLLIGNAVTSLIDNPPAAYYQVLEIVSGGPGANVIQNPSFETSDVNSCGAANWTGSANSPDGAVVGQNSQVVYATNQWSDGVTTLNPTDGSYMIYMEGTTSNATPTAPNTYVQSDFSMPVIGGLQYNLQFQAANPVQVGGGNPQYHIFWADDLNTPKGDVFGSFSSAGTTWKQFNFTNTAPAGATKMWVSFFQAVGAGTSWDWVTLIDAVNVYGIALPGSTNVLTPVLNYGNTFTATIQTNGVTATSATGTVSFKTNNIALSAGGVSSGVAISGNAILLPPYTVTAVYSGDSTYIGSTNTLSVGSGSNFGPGPGMVSLGSGTATVVMSGVEGKQYSLQRATNVLFTAGISNFPAIIAPVGGNVTNMDNFSDLGAVPATAFYRLQYIP